ncbi:hypothetical protein AHAS_Ahas05G0104500 [Arachis hypogaea]
MLRRQFSLFFLPFLVLSFFKSCQVSHHPFNHYVPYACGSSSESRSVFHKFSNKKDIFLYNATSAGQFHAAVCCQGLRWFTEVKLEKALHALALKLELCSNSFVENALIAMYRKCGFVESAFKVFEKMPKKNLISWNSIMLVCSENGPFDEICGLFKELLLNGDGDEGWFLMLLL